MSRTVHVAGALKQWPCVHVAGALKQWPGGGGRERKGMEGKEEERKLRRKGKENAGKERRADHGGGWERSAGLTMVGPAERSVWPVPHPLGY